MKLSAGKVAGVAAGAAIALVAAPVAPGRLAFVLAALFPVAGFMAPDALRERRARRRRQKIEAALPDVLDLLAVAVSAGRSVGAAIRDVARLGSDPLAAELAVVAADLEAGVPQATAVESLCRRTETPALDSLAATLARSRRHGVALADQLRDQATAMRRDERRRVGERAARAAPKIQLVVALVLVPSVLLMIVAGLIANAETLLGDLVAS